MQHVTHFRSLTRIGALSGVFLTAALSGVTAQLCWAQPDNPFGASATPATEATSKSSHTPKEVLSGSAKLIGEMAPTTTVHVVLGLTPPKLAEEEKFLKDLQDPKSTSFHKYLTPEQWNARFAPSAKDEQAVVDWAESNGLKVTGRGPDRLVVDVDGTPGAVEKAFAVKMNSYDLAGKTEFSNDRDPVIPAHLVNILHSVSGLNSIQRLRTPRGGSADPKNSVYSPGVTAGATVHGDGNKAAFEEALKASENAKGTSSAMKSLTPGAGQLPAVTSGFIDPSDIYSSYGYSYGALQNQGHCCNPTHNSGGTTASTSIAIATSGAINYNDTAGFQSRYSYLSYNLSNINVDGNYTCNNSSGLDDSCVETTLDTEWALATANSFGSYLDTSHVYIYQAANAGLGTFTDMFRAILNNSYARVMSTSWGCGEFDCYDSGTMDTDHAIFDSMVGQGWTLLASSDDQGAVADCGSVKRVSYPASDPDVTAVGGTSLALYSDGTFYSETGWQGATYSGACSQNNGGSGGGCSTKFAAPGYQTNPFCGSSGRSVPDISLNAGYGQNVYYNGAWYGFGGTSIATPQVAGFMAQANAYLLALGTSATVGNADNEIYYFAHNPNYAQHYPYYDMTSGCNNNDITAANSTGYFCAVSGYDRVTGWGSFNALQLSWAINAYFLGDFAAPTVHFSGPAGVGTDHYTYFNTDQTVSWTVTDAGSGSLGATGVAGFTQGWDTAVSDPTSETTHGTGNAFYNGPQFPNATSGYLSLAAAGEGCHYAAVDAWDNSGYTSGNQYFYWICYDVTKPVTTASLSGSGGSPYYSGPVQVTLSATDNLAVGSTVYQVDGGAVITYSGPFTISSAGNPHTVTFHSVDKAGNVESTKSISFREKVFSTTTLTSSLNPSIHSQNVTITATVTTTSGAPTSNIVFKDGSTVLATVPLNSAGKATYTTGAFTVGTHSITGVYQGDALHLGGTSAVFSQRVKNSTATTLVSLLNPTVHGMTADFKATVTGSAPTLNVQFLDGTTVLATVPINSSGVALYSTASLSVGTHNITAVYTGDSTHGGSTSNVIAERVKNFTSTSLVSSANPVTHGKTVTFTATASGSAPTGDVQFLDGTTVLATKTLSAGKAAFATSTLSVGTHSITAKYLGDATHGGSTSSAVSEKVQ